MTYRITIGGFELKQNKIEKKKPRHNIFFAKFLNIK